MKPNYCVNCKYHWHPYIDYQIRLRENYCTKNEKSVKDVITGEPFYFGHEQCSVARKGKESCPD